MTAVKHLAAWVTVGGLLAASTLVYAQAPTPTQADFDRCNRLAQAKVKSPSASPGTGTSTLPGGSSASTAKPSTDMSTSGGASAPTADPTLRGIAAAGVSDPAYQQAYRDCIQGK